MTNEDDSNRHWVIRLGVADRAGALTSVSSAFSNRGVTIETIVGHGMAFPDAPGGTVVVTFRCSPRDKDEIVRVVRRLNKVHTLEERAYESENLRKSAVVCTSRRLAPRDVAGVEAFLTCELMSQPRGEWRYFLAGSPSELDPVLARFVEEGILTDVVFSVIGS